jgi:excisionase family DNA binding protein
MRSREAFFTPWQAADYTGLKIEALYELLESGEIAGEKIDGRWRIRKSVLDTWLDTEVEPEELHKLAAKMTQLSEEQARQVLEELEREKGEKGEEKG